MTEIDAADAGTKLDHLLDRVEAGEEIIITRAGRPAGRLVAPAASAAPGVPEFTWDRQKAREAVESIKERRKGVTLGGLSIKDLINEGRR